MGIPRFFKTKESKRFNYSPLYWNPEKEAREHRIRSIEQEMGIGTKTKPHSSTITRGAFRQNASNSRVKANRNSNRRILLILLILLLIAYIFLYR